MDNSVCRMSCILDQMCLYIKYGGLGVCMRKLDFTISQVHPKVHHSVVLSVVLKPIVNMTSLLCASYMQRKNLMSIVITRWKGVPRVSFPPRATWGLKSDQFDNGLGWNCSE